MKFDRNLFLSEIILPPSGEWTDASEGWRLVRLSTGAAYWLAEGAAREIKEGEILAIPPSNKGCLRASQLGEVKLHWFQFCPDEPCSALDVEGTRAIEELMLTLKGRYTMVSVTHNMAQARRASDECIFMLLGEIIEHTRTEQLFLTPKNSRTAEYIEGRYG